MELLREIQGWIYPGISLGLMIFCLVVIKRKGSGLLAAGFGINFLTSLSWRVIELSRDFFGYNPEMVMYGILQQVSFFSNIGFSILFVFGILSLINSSTLGSGNRNGFDQGNTQSDSSFLGSTTIYLVPLYIGFFTIVSSLMVALEGRNEEVGLIMLLLGVCALMFAQIYFLVLLYRLWHFVIEKCNRNKLNPSIDSAGKAVGFLFIPFFNFYWVFKSFGALPKDLNSIARAENNTAIMPEGLGIAIAILSVVGIIPFVGYITAIVVSLILTPVFVSLSIGMCEKIMGHETDQELETMAKQSEEIKET